MSKQKLPAGSQTGKTGDANRQVLSRFLALEPRVLLDAAAVETAAKIIDGAAVDAPADTSAGDALASSFLDAGVVASPLSTAGGAQQILFVDAGIDNFEALFNDLGAGVEVHVLQQGDWASQVQSVLSRRDGDVTAIHIASHGSAGSLTLGGTSVDLTNIDSYSRAWSAMQQALTADGDILVYGCDVGAGDAGAAFVEALADRTGADIAASNDLTGVAALGGDWDLEVSRGEVGATSLYADNSNDDFMGLLADSWVQDTELTTGKSSVAITRTSDGIDFKFVSQSAAGPNGHGQVDVYKRNPSTGAWVWLETLTHQSPPGWTDPVGSIKAQFGYDVAAAGNKVAISAPAFDPSTANASDGRVFVFTWNGTTWKSTAAGPSAGQIIDHKNVPGSGRTGFNGGSSDINDSRGTADQWGYSVDIATDGAGNYKLVVGNPYEDWWEYDNDDNDGAWGGSAVTRNERDDMGSAYVFSASAHGQFDETTTATSIVSQTGGTTDGHHFGAVVSATYDVSGASWWIAVGADGDNINQVRVYKNPTQGANIDGFTYTQALGWDSSGTNDVSMDDDYMSIANASSVQAYKINAGATGYDTAGAAFGAGGAAVSIDDWDQSAGADGSGSQGAKIIYSAPNITAVAQLTNAVTGWTGVQLSTRQEISVAIDRYRSMDVIGTNGTDVTSYHYNFEPVVVNDTATTNEDTSVVTDVITTEYDRNISATTVPPTGFTGYTFSSPNYLYGMFGDSLYVSAVSASAYGAAVSASGDNVTYNPTASTFLQTLAVGQTLQDTILVTISDGQGGNVQQTLIHTVTGVNDAPVVNSLTPLSPYAAQQSGSTAAYDFGAYFDDVDAGEDSQLAPSATALPSGWSAVTDGTLLRVTIPQGWAAGPQTITVRMQDPQGAYSGTRSFVINVDAVNNAPVVAVPAPDQVALAGYAFSYTMPTGTFTDPDPLPYDNLTYTATLSSGAALPAWLTFDAATRTFSGTPSTSDAGTLTVRVTATDDAASKGRGANLSVFDDFSLVVATPTPKTLSVFTDGPAASADFGFSVAISENGNAMVVGAPGNNTVWYYLWNSGTLTWDYQGGITGPVAGAKFGWSVDLSADGTKLVVGARNETVGGNVGQGAVYMYTRASASAGVLFSTGAGTFGKYTATGGIANDYFGTSVALNEAGNNVIIGASHFDYGTFSDSGAAFWYGTQFTATTAIAANILPKDLADFDRFGTSVAFDENIIVISSAGDDNAAGMVSRIDFSNSSGNYASPSFGSVGGTLSSEAQFTYDGTRGNVVYLTGTTGKVTLDSAIDLGASWTISSWYNMGATTSASYRTLTRGSSDHQIIINSGTNDLGVWNNTGVGVTGFNPAFASEQQILVVKATPTTAFTLTVPGIGTTAAITHSTTGTTMATNIQTALNTMLSAAGAGTATVSVVTEGANDSLRVTFSNTQLTLDLLSSNSTAVTAARSQQLLTFSDTGTNFTITVPGVGTTGAIAYSEVAATQATNIQTALNALLGANAVEVTSVTDTATSPADTVRVIFKNIAGYNNLTCSKAMAVTNTLAGTTNYALTAGQLSGWHMITASAEGTGVNARTNYYIDGVKVGSSFYKATDDIAVVGNFQGDGQRFADYVDDFRVYNRALSQSEIREVYAGRATAESAYGDAGSLYVWSTDMNAQVAKLYAPDPRNGDMLGWSIDVDIYNSRGAGIIVASSIYSDAKATDGGAVYVWRSTGQSLGGTDNNGGNGNGTWRYETKLTSFDTTANDYFGNDVALDYDESTGGTRLLVGAPFEDTNGSYSGAVYAFKYSSGSWLPEKFTDAVPQGGSLSNSEFFGSAVAVADTRAVIGARWRDNGGQLNDGAAFWANLQTQGNYATILSAETSAAESFFLPTTEQDVVLLDTSSTQGTVSYGADGQMVYTPGAAFKSLGLGQSATDSFTYLVERGGVTYVNTVSVTVYGVDDAVQAGMDSAVVSASGRTLVNVLANDFDPDQADASLFVQSVSSTDLQGRVYNTGTELVYDPRGKFDALRAGETAQETFTYTVTDANGIQSTGHVTLLVAGEDDPVVAVDDSVTVKANGVATINVIANDLDKDGQGTFWVSSIDQSAARGQIVSNIDGTLTYVPGDAFDYLKPGETAIDRIVYTVRDDTGNESSAMLTILVIGENDAPTARNDGVTAAAGETVTVDALANDVDPDGDTLRITRVIDTMTLGTVTLNDDGTISYTGPADLVTDRFEYEIVDSRGEVSTATVFVNWPVDPPDVPVLPGAVDDVAVTRGTDSVSIPVTDNDGGRTIVSLTVEGGNGTLSVGEGNTVVYTPNPELANLHSGRVFVDTFAYVVQYDDGSVGTASVRVYVNGTYVTPTIEDDEELVVAPKSAAEVAGAAVVAPEAPATRTETAFALPESAAARIALDALSEFTAPDVSMGEQPAAAEPAPAGEGEGKEATPAKPGLSAMLGRESQARRAGVDALLRHFNSSAA